MGLLDGLMKEVMQSAGGGNGQALVQSVLAMLTNNPVPGSPAPVAGGLSGGLTGLVQAMEQNGLGHVVSSWVSTGPNPPITPDQVTQVIGAPQLQQLADQHGIDVQQLTAQLANILPVAVDKLTPGGSLPAGGATGGLAGGLGGMLGDALKGFTGGGGA